MIGAAVARVASAVILLTIRAPPVHDLPWGLTMYPTVHSFGMCGDAIATAEA